MTQADSDDARNQAQRKGHDLMILPAGSCPADKTVHALGKEEREDEPCTQIPDKMLTIRNRRQQQRIRRQRRAQLKAAKAPERRRAETIDQIPYIQR